MTEPSPNALPTAEQVRTHLAQHPARPPSRPMTWLPLIALGVVLLLFTFGAGGWLGVFPWLIVFALFAFMSSRVRQLRHLEMQVLRAQELSILRHRSEALRLAWTLLPKLNMVPELHKRILAILGHNLDQLQQCDAAIVVFDYLLERLPAQHPGAVQLLIHRTLAQLTTDLLADADVTLRRLRTTCEKGPPNPTASSYRLASLLQRVRTHHWLDAVREEETLLDDLRPLGMEAAFGHALMALSFYQLDPLDHPSAPEFASKWWHRATTLMQPDTLIKRAPELRPLADSNSASNPLANL